MAKNSSLINILACKRSLPHQVCFAEQAGVASTKEGQVKYAPGDALVNDTAGNQWPITRTHFELRYEAIPPCVMGRAGLYRKKPVTVTARQMQHSFTVELSNRRGTLKGKAGDYLIEEPNGAQFIVDANIFEESYVVFTK